MWCEPHEYLSHSLLLSIGLINLLAVCGHLSDVELLGEQSQCQALLQNLIQGPRHHRGRDHPYTETPSLLTEIHTPVPQVLRVESS